MSTTVSTLQELLEAIASANDNDSIQLLDSISITSSTEIASSVNLTIDLNSNSISISVEKGLFITGGTYTFINGSITSAVSDGIWAEGADTSVTFGSNLAVTGIGTVVDVQKKSNLVIDGGSITSVAGDGPAVSVEGYTNANTNSAITVYYGTVDGGSNNAINVSKKGACYVHGGIISSEVDAICKADDTATIVEITCGTFKGNIPEGVVDESIATISEPNENGFYTVITNDTDADVDAETDTETDVDPVDIDTDTDVEPVDPVDLGTDTDADTETDVDPEPEPIPDPDTDTDVDTDMDIDTDSDTETDTDTEEPEPTPAESKSFVIKKSARIFKTPSLKHPIDDIVGSILILDGTYEDSNGISYKKVKYTLPGSGRKAVGYVFASAVNGDS